MTRNQKHSQKLEAKQVADKICGCGLCVMPGMNEERNTLAQEQGRRRLFDTWRERGTGEHNEESGKTIRLVTHEEGQVI